MYKYTVEPMGEKTGTVAYCCIEQYNARVKC